MQEIGKVIGGKVREAREERKLTQKDLGDILGYSAMGISHFENGVREMKISDIQKLSDFFGKPLSYFLSPGLVMFRADGKHEAGVSESLNAFDKFLIQRRKKQ